MHQAAFFLLDWCDRCSCNAICHFVSLTAGMLGSWRPSMHITELPTDKRICRSILGAASRPKHDYAVLSQPVLQNASHSASRPPDLYAAVYNGFVVLRTSLWYCSADRYHYGLFDSTRCSISTCVSHMTATLRDSKPSILCESGVMRGCGTCRQARGMCSRAPGLPAGVAHCAGYPGQRGGVEGGCQCPRPC